MGKILGGIFGVTSDFRANTGGQNFAQAIQGSQGQYNQANQGQTSLAQALQQQMGGSGPNPAQIMLNQATDKNIKNNAALIASSKGINPALAQRLAAQNAATIGQEAAGQGALLAAKQQNDAQGQLANVYGQMGNQANQNLGLNQGALNSNNQINAGIDMQNTQSQNAVVGGLINGGAAVMSGGATAGAGAVKHAHGGMVEGPEVVPGDSEKNDLVPILASGGEGIIPKSKMSDPQKAHAFLDAIMKDKASKEEDGSGYGKILELKRRVAMLEKKVAAR
jgi:hypothetical protein